MSRFMLGNVFLVLSMISVTASHIMIKALMEEWPGGGLGWNALLQFLGGDRILRGGIAGVLLVAGFVSWLACLTRLDLSYAYPVASSSVLFVVLFSVLVLGETVSWRMWVGTGLIVVGIAFLRPAA